MTENRPLTPGDEVEAKCLKCKGVTTHIIVAIDVEIIAKVQCKVCNGIHRYRPPVALKAQARTRKSAALPKGGGTATERRKASKEAALFADSMAGRETVEGIPYSMTASFRENTLIRHPKFGLGVVLKTIGPNKIEVRFEAGTKVLVCIR